MKYGFNIKSRRGNLLVESIVSISITIIGFLGVLGLLSRSLGINKDVGQKFVATYLAAEGVEVVKSMVDKSFTDGLAWNDCCAAGDWEAAYDSVSLSPVPASPNPLLFDTSEGIYGYASGVSSPFSRVIQISEIDWNTDGRTDDLKVVSRVSWSSRGTVQEVILEDHFFDWR
jgi:hypothetical protein